MLKLTGISKTYSVGDMSQEALSDLSISFRRSEFVSILGQSGSGKTTLLNIIGGLDQYTDGDLVINGRSTKEYTDSDWDAYRNHSVGFVFQSYNLIPHQSVLANVELALTLSGVSKAERRKRASEALERVGLRDQMRKKPNQMSGGQMQRVAIARALVNNPDILLADEPTGALDSETSVQVLDILKEVSRERLVIMVTHNPDLAERYSTRIIKLLDGKVTDDSDPYDGEDEVEQKMPEKREKGAKKPPSMSFFTAMSLSLNNLLTKKARTILTSFAGSIGIIGIALVLSVSTGFQAYVDKVQEDTLSSYPIMIEAESVDMTSLLKSLSDEGRDSVENTGHELDAVYENAIMYELMNTMNSADVNVNNLTKLREYIESSEQLDEYVSAVQYVYDMGFSIYTKDINGKVMKSDASQLFGNGGMRAQSSSSASMSALTGGRSSFNVWEEMLSGRDGQIISDTVKGQYEVIAGDWPTSANEIMLVVDKNNEVNDLVLYALGLKSSEEMAEIMKSAMKGEKIDTGDSRSWTYDEIMGMTFKLILKSECWQKNGDGGYTDLSQNENGLDYLYGSEDVGINLKVSGIIRGSKNAAASMMSGSIVYTGALSDKAMELSAASDIIKEQLADPETDVISGLPFPSADGETITDAEKAERIKEHIASLTADEKAAIYIEIASTPTEEYLDQAVEAQLAVSDRATLEQMLIAAYAQSTGMTDTSSISSYISAMSDEELFKSAADGMRPQISAAYTEQAKAQLAAMTVEQLAGQLDAAEYTESEYAAMYDKYMPTELSTSTYEDILTQLGYVLPEKPSAIKLYAISFENKDEIARLIDEYNESADPADRITYTDYVALLMSSVTTIINAITYVLIAFVAISLVVSSIMIGIITYISVLERTKEIGLLRAVGASKRDVSNVFNAETIIVGLTAGLIGIGVTLLSLIPINAILHYLTKIENLSAILPVGGALILIAVSVALTFIAGLIPSGIASKKNPVEALRTE